MKPDFSGDFVLNRPASTLSPAGAAQVQSGRLRIEHREPQFRCQLRFVFDDGKTFESSFELATKARDVTQMEPGASLYWDGDVLVFTHRDATMTMTFRYELVDGGRRLHMTEALRGTDHDQDNIWVLDRQ